MHVDKAWISDVVGVKPQPLILHTALKRFGAFTSNVY